MSTPFPITIQAHKLRLLPASTGNICTVRCRNNALAGPFGGCFAVQQTDNEGRPQNQAASAIETAQTLDGISKQIQVNQADFKTAIEANQAAGAAGGGAGAAAAEALINGTENAGAAASAAAAADSANNGNNNQNNNNNQNTGNNNQNSNNNNNNNNNQNQNQNQNNNGNGGNNNRNGGNNNNGGSRNGFGNFFGNNKAKRQVLHKRLSLPFLS